MRERGREGRGRGRGRGRERGEGEKERERGREGGEGRGGREGGREGGLVPRLLPFNETHVGRESGRSTRREGGRERDRPHYPILPLQKMTFLYRSRLPLGRLRSTRLSLVPFTRRCLVAHTSPVEGDGNGNNTPKPPPLNPPPTPRWSKQKQHPQTPLPDGGNGNNTPLWKWVGAVSALVAALVGALGLVWNFSRDGLLWNYVNVWRVKRGINASKLKMPQVAGYIKRNQEMKAFNKMLNDPEYLQTIVVTGPRGSGKSTLVQHCLADKSRVVRFCLNTQSDFSGEEFAENVMKTIKVSYAQPGTYVTALLSVALQVMRGLRKSLEELPIFVVEVDRRCTPDQLQSLLLLMKQYGADEKLIRPIIVLSSSTSAFGLTINEVELRSRYFHVDDLTDKQCLEYIESRLSRVIKGDKKKISEFVENVVPHLGMGNRLVQIMDVLMDISELNLDKVQKHIESCVEERVRIYTESMISFLEEVKGTWHSKEAIKRELQLLSEKGSSMPLHTFRKVCGIKEKRLIEIISNIEPHPFYVNPKHRTIHFHAIFQRQINFDILFDSV